MGADIHLALPLPFFLLIWSKTPARGIALPTLFFLNQFFLETHSQTYSEVCLQWPRDFSKIMLLLKRLFNSLPAPLPLSLCVAMSVRAQVHLEVRSTEPSGTGAGASGACEPPSAGDGNKTWVLWKSRSHSEPSLQPPLGIASPNQTVNQI